MRYVRIFAALIAVMFVLSYAPVQAQSVEADIAKEYRNAKISHLDLGAAEPAARSGRPITIDSPDGLLQINLSLNDNRSDEVKQDKEQIGRKINTFAGTVSGDNGSWVRINLTNDFINGVVTLSSGRQFYINQAKNVSPQAANDVIYVVNPLDQKDQTVPALNLHDDTAISTARKPFSKLGASFINASFGQPAARAARFVTHPYSPMKVYNIEVTADNEFYQSPGNSNVTTTYNEMDYEINIADGVFQNQIGIDLVVVGYHTFKGNDGITNTGDSETTSLANFRSFVLTFFQPNTTGRRHSMLFSNYNSTSNSGFGSIAASQTYPGYICYEPASQSLIVKQSFHYPAVGWMTTHELGHAVGVGAPGLTPHPDPTGWLMNQYLNASSVTTFHSNSLNDIFTYLDDPNKNTCGF
jgi:hypothetical protein